MTADMKSPSHGSLTDVVGWGQVLGLTVLAYVLGQLVGPINAVIAALLLGFLAANLSPIVPRSEAVATFMLKRVLKFAIILLGAGVDATLLSQVNVGLVGIIFASIVLALVMANVVGPVVGLSRETSLLIGVGTAICGASAIAAVAPIVKAKKDEVGLALGTIFIFNALALIVLPVIAVTSGMDSFAFGAWSGIAVHDTASAVATGFAYSTEAGEVATLVKLTRTLFLIPLVVILAFAQSTRGLAESEVPVGRSVRKTFPLFVLGFVATATANSVGLLGDLGGDIANVGRLLVVGVVVAIGLSLQVSKIRAVGFALAATGMAAAITVASVGLWMVTSRI